MTLAQGVIVLAQVGERNPERLTLAPLRRGFFVSEHSRSLQLDRPHAAFPAIERGQLIARRGGSGLGRSVISLVSRSRVNWNSRIRCKIFAAQIASYTHSVGHRSLV